MFAHVFGYMLFLAMGSKFCTDLGYEKTVKVFDRDGSPVSITCHNDAFYIRFLNSSALYGTFLSYDMQLIPKPHDADSPPIWFFRNNRIMNTEHQCLHIGPGDNITLIPCDQPDDQTSWKYLNSSRQLIPMNKGYRCLGINNDQSFAEDKDAADKAQPKARPCHQLSSTIWELIPADMPSVEVIVTPPTSGDGNKPPVGGALALALMKNTTTSDDDLPLCRLDYSPLVPTSIVDAYAPSLPVSSFVLRTKPYAVEPDTDPTGGFVVADDLSTHLRGSDCAFKGLFLALYGDLADKAVSRTSFDYNQTLEEYKAQCTYPAFAHDDLAAYSTMFRESMQNDFCQSLIGINRAEFFMYRRKIVPFGDLRLRTQVRFCTKTVSEHVMLSPQLALVRLLQDNSPEEDGYSTLDYKIARFYVAEYNSSMENYTMGLLSNPLAFPDLDLYNKKIKMKAFTDLDGPWIEQEVINDPVYMLTGRPVDIHGDQKYIPYASVLGTDLDYPIGRDSYGSRFIFMSGLKSDTLYRAVTVLVSESSSKHVARIFNMFRTPPANPLADVWRTPANSTVDQVNTKLNAAIANGTTKFCLHQLGTGQCSSQRYQCGLARGMLDNAARSSTSSMHDFRRLKESYLEDCCVSPKSNPFARTQAGDSLGSPYANLLSECSYYGRRTRMSVMYPDMLDRLLEAASEQRDALTDEQCYQTQLLRDYFLSVNQTLLSHAMQQRGDPADFLADAIKASRLFNVQCCGGFAYRRNMAGRLELEIDNVFVEKSLRIYDVKVKLFKPDDQVALEIGSCFLNPSRDPCLGGRLSSCETTCSYKAPDDSSEAEATFYYGVSKPTDLVLHFNLRLSPAQYEQCVRPAKTLDRFGQLAKFTHRLEVDPRQTTRVVFFRTNSTFRMFEHEFVCGARENQIKILADPIIASPNLELADGKFLIQTKTPRLYNLTYVDTTDYSFMFMGSTDCAHMGDRSRHHCNQQHAFAVRGGGLSQSSMVRFEYAGPRSCQHRFLNVHVGDSVDTYMSYLQASNPPAYSLLVNSKAFQKLHVDEHSGQVDVQQLRQLLSKVGDLTLIASSKNASSLLANAIDGTNYTEFMRMRSMTKQRRARLAATASSRGSVVTWYTLPEDVPEESLNTVTVEFLVNSGIFGVVFGMIIVWHIAMRKLALTSSKRI